MYEGLWDLAVASSVVIAQLICQDFGCDCGKSTAIEVTQAKIKILGANIWEQISMIERLAHVSRLTG